MLNKKVVKTFGYFILVCGLIGIFATIPLILVDITKYGHEQRTWSSEWIWLLRDVAFTLFGVRILFLDVVKAGQFSSWGRLKYLFLPGRY